MNAVAAAAGGREVRVMGLIGVGHFLSHFYLLTLAPVFPLLQREFAVGYVELGALVTGYGLIGGLLQAPVGALVDRLGARWVLVAGLGLNAAAIAAISQADAYWQVFVLAVVAGIGNCVFHPADYAIMSGSIDRGRLGRAYSIHTFTGFFGSAVAPLAMVALAADGDWRFAFGVVGLAGLVATAMIALGGGILHDDRAMAPKRAGADDTGVAAPSTMRLLLTPAILFYLMFLFAYGVASSGLSQFTTSALVDLGRAGFETANTVLSAYLFSLSAGILAGGVLADRTTRHGLHAAVMLLGAAFMIVVSVVLAPGEAVIFALFVAIGFAMGAVLPARDLMVRAITPEGASGKVFGFVFVGLSLGSALGPLLFGSILDADLPALVFLLAAVFLVLAVGATTGAQIAARRRDDERRAQEPGGTMAAATPSSGA